MAIKISIDKPAVLIIKYKQWEIKAETKSPVERLKLTFIKRNNKGTVV